MPNPVAVNDLSPISGSLQTSRISYGVETAGKNYGQNYNSTNWYSDIPNNGQFYTIISDNYTANYYVSRSNAGGAYVEGGLPAVDDYSAPVFWITAGTSSLDVITIVNGLPDRIGQVPFNSGSQALNWVASSSNYFAVGPDYYDQIDADQIALYLDSNQIISYPTTASTWYDISGYNWKATLINGPSFNTTYNTINFDDTNDYGIFPGSNGDILSSASYASGNATWEGIVRFNAGTGTDAVITKWDNSTGANWWFGRYPTNTVHLALITSAGYQGLLSSNTIPTTTTQFQQIAVTTSGSNYVFYINGVNAGSGTYSGTWYPPDFDTPVVVGAQDISTGGAAFFGGDMSKVRLYNKTLSATEILQNYYGGPIVTSSLYSMLDAGNLISYPRTGTTAYTLTGSVNGNLTNGPSFTPAFGGGWVMDGVDDYLDTAVSSTTITPTNSWTVNIWCSLNSYPTISGTPKEGILFGHAYYGGLGIYAISSTTGVVDIYGYFRSDSSSAIFGSYQLTLNTPTMFTLTHEAGVGCKFYVNGQLNTSSNTTGGSWPNYMPNPFYLLSPQNGVYGGGANTYIYYPITTYSTQVYNNKTLTADEVLQNYNATK
jgi:hypothetical protein